MRILVCGASGFIGRNVFETFSEKRSIELIGTCFNDRFSDDMRLVDVDLTKRENALDITTNMDLVIHAAAVTGGMDAVKEKPERFIADNVLMNTNLIEAAYRNKVPHFIFLSCTVMYPDSTWPLREEEFDLRKIHPSYFPLANLKVFAEDLCRFYSSQGETRYTVLRPSSVYGPYDKFSLETGHMLDATIARVINSQGENIPIRTENATRDFLHVYDLVRLIEMVTRNRAEGYRFSLFNAASGVSTSIRELTEKIVKISGKDLKVIYDSVKMGIDSKTSLDIRKAAQCFDWKSRIDLDRGLRHTIDWYQWHLKNSRRKKDGR